MSDKIEIKTNTEQKLLDDLKKSEEENEILRSCLDSVSAWEKERKEHSLKIARQTVERDSKPVANIILNMSYDYHTHVSFCDIFNLKEKCGCEEKYCTECIHKFLKQYFDSMD